MCPLAKLFAVLWLATAAGAADPSAAEILQRVLAHRAPKDFSLQARLFLSPDRVVPATLLVRNTATGAATLLRAGHDELLILQPDTGPVRFYDRAGEITGAAVNRRFAGSQFTLYDLGLPFLRWPNVKRIGAERHRGRDCHVIEATATGAPYGRMVLWIDQTFAALLRADGYDADGNLVKRLAVTSFKRLGDLWVPRAIEAATVPPGQALPAQEKSRLEVYAGDYDTQLPAEWFDPQSFSRAAPR